MNPLRHYLPRNDARSFAVFIAFLGVAVLNEGCGKSAPTKDSALQAMAAVIPAQFAIVGGEMEYRTTSAKEGMARMKIKVSPKEDLYAPSQPDPAVLTVGQKEHSRDELNAANQKADRQGVQVPAGFFDDRSQALAAFNEAIGKANKPWIELVAKSGAPITVYGSVKASFEMKEWNFSNARLDQPIGVGGQPRSAFARDVLIVASPRAATLAADIAKADNALQSALDDASTRVDRLIEQKHLGESEVAKRKESIEQERRAVILRAVAKGSHYEGRWGTRAVAIEFIECNPPGTLIRARVYDPADPKLSRNYTGAAIFDPQAARGYPVHLNGEAPVQGSGIPYLYAAKGGDSEIFLTATAEGLEGRPSYYQGEPIVAAKAK